MTNWNPRANELFLRALELGSPSERQQFLDRACAGDAALRAEVDALLAASAQAGSFLESPVAANPAANGSEVPRVGGGATVDAPISEGPGTVIGQYKLLEQIGEGGFGVVFMAEQAQPVRRKVALKILKPGMDTRQVVARFEAERQALAIMDHPNIAKVFDGGATATGRPYFVMELVKGMPITEYCDQNQLTPRQRLELFIPVCQAVQHAHQKGIIHRDLKPSNILVVMHDTKPVPKVIDFGVAKALGQELTDKTLFTGFAQMIGTPLYMSPEQAGQSGLDIDTRSDIYALGVLLYELLTGTTPFTKERFKKAAYDEIRRIIREEEPPRPSTRLSELNNPHAPREGGVTRSVTSSLASVAALRQTEPTSLTKLVRGELDWIVMKALEKDRNRRYETANGFVQDIQRYLADEPVQACPPSAGYRLKKFARRNRGALAVVFALVLALVVGIVGLAVSNYFITQERDAKGIALEAAKQAEAREAAQRKKAEANYQTARRAVDQLLTRVAEELRDQPYMEHLRRGLLEDALKFYQGFLAERSDDPLVQYETALSFRRAGEIHGLLGDWKKSLENCRAAVLILEALTKQTPASREYRDQLAHARFHSAEASFRLMALTEGAATMEEAIALWESLAKEFPSEAAYLQDLVRANARLGKAWSSSYYAKGESYANRSLQLLTRHRKEFPKHPLTPSFLREVQGLARWRFNVLPHDAAGLKLLEREAREHLARAESEANAHPHVPDRHKEVADWLSSLIQVLLATNRFQEVDELSLRRLEILKRLAGQHAQIPEYQVSLGWAHFNRAALLQFRERPNEAAEHYRIAIATATAVVDKHPDIYRYQIHLAGMLTECPSKQFRDGRRAIGLVMRSFELGSTDLPLLAGAQAHAGDFRESLETCRKASGRKQSEAYLTIVESLANWHLGNKELARKQLRLVNGLLDREPNKYWYSPQFRLLRREFEELMGIEPLPKADGVRGQTEGILSRADCLHFSH